MTLCREIVLDIGQALAYIREVKSNRPKGLTAEKVRAALIACDGSTSRAAVVLGVTRQTIYDWRKKHKIRLETVVVTGDGAEDAA